MITNKQPMAVRKFIKNMKIEMRKQGIDQMMLAKKTKMTQPAISYLVSGKQKGMTLASAVIISKALGKDLKFMTEN